MRWIWLTDLAGEAGDLAGDLVAGLARLVFIAMCGRLIVRSSHSSFRCCWSEIFDSDVRCLSVLF